MCPPRRDLCDVHTSEKCVSDFTRGGRTQPRPVELDMYVTCNMFIH